MSVSTPLPDGLCPEPSFGQIDLIRRRVRQLGGRAIKGTHSDRYTEMVVQERTATGRTLRKKKQVELAACGHETLVDVALADRRGFARLCIVCDCLQQTPRFSV